MPNLKTVFIGWVFLSCLISVQGSKNVYQVNIDERGTHFNETVEVNRREKSVAYKVPAHNDVAQSDVLFDYKTGYSATRIPKLKECLIQRIQKPSSSPVQIRKNLQQYEKLKRSKSKIPVKTIIAASVKERKIDETELSSLFLKFCGGYEAYEVKHIFQQPFNLERNETNGKIRQKRAYTVPLEKIVVMQMKIDVWTRKKKNANEWTKLTLNTCKKLKEYYPDLKKGGCDEKPDDWEYHCGAKTSSCIYYVKCKLDNGKIRCRETHFYTGWTCCKVMCP